MKQYKNVLILTDMEGVSGITDARQVLDFSDRAYIRSPIRLMADTNAAVAGCFEADAERVFVWDGHMGGKNFIREMLDARAEEIYINNVMSVLPVVDAVMLVGTHAMAGTQNAFMDHTELFDGVHRSEYNGEAVGEIMQFAAFAGHYGIPLVMVSGDEAACAEAERFCPGVRAAVVKRATERMHTCSALGAEEAAALIRRMAAEGLRCAAEVQPVRMALPFTITVEFNTTDRCEEACRKPGVERIDGYRARSVTNEVNGYLDFLL